jgi:thioredoxin 1
MATSADVVHVTSANFESFSKAKAALIDFSATWCGPCQVLAPIVNKLAAEFKGKVSVGAVDIDEEPDLAGQFGVMAVPTLVFFKDGKMVDQQAGLLPEGALRQRMQKLTA